MLVCLEKRFHCLYEKASINDLPQPPLAQLLVDGMAGTATAMIVLTPGCHQLQTKEQSQENHRKMKQIADTMSSVHVKANLLALIFLRIQLMSNVRYIPSALNEQLFKNLSPLFEYITAAALVVWFLPAQSWTLLRGNKFRPCLGQIHCHEFFILLTPLLPFLNHFLFCCSMFSFYFC